jgi:hypothetical protein
VRGEPGTPDNPAEGHVWTSIVSHVDDVGWADEWINVVDLDRKVLATHPWVLRGGFAGQIQQLIERAPGKLGNQVRRIGFMAMSHADQAFTLTPDCVRRMRLSEQLWPPLVSGEVVRDYVINVKDRTYFPYKKFGEIQALLADSADGRWLWPLRTDLGNRATFGGGTYLSEGRLWYEWHQVPKDKGTSSLSIAFAFVATHNHFVLNRGGKVFKQSAPIIKLPHGASEDEHLALLGVLNSSTACFWLKQVSHGKGNGGIGGGIGDEPWEPRYEFTGMTLEDYPLPSSSPLERARLLDSLAQDLSTREPSAVCTRGIPSREALASAQKEFGATRARMIAVQEELDWEMYLLYGFIDDDLTYSGEDLPELALGERAFEIDLAESGEETAWFERHGSNPITEIPTHWPTAYQELVRRRLELIAEHPYIRLLEKPEYKRRWAQESWDKRQERAVRGWLLDRLEDRRFWCDVSGSAVAKSVGQLADEVTRDPDMGLVLVLWEGRPDVPVTDSLVRLLEDEAVPFLAAYRYKDSGLRKREAWEETWATQRREDAGEKVDDIQVPPKYTSADFRKPSYWRARGKLDVPKERFILYSDASREGDSTPLLGWAGWDHAQQALALAAIINDREQEGWDDERLVPLVAGLAELQPWVEQWHTEVISEYGASYAEICREELDQRAAQVGKTMAELAAWRPAAPARGRKKAAKG